MNIEVDNNEGLHYLGTKNVDPGYHDYLVWPHKTVFEGNDGHLYAYHTWNLLDGLYGVGIRLNAQLKIIMQ